MTGLESLVLWLLLYVADTKEMQWSRLEPTTYRNPIECNVALRRARALIGELQTTDAASATLLCLPEDVDPLKLPRDLFLPRRCCGRPAADGIR
jgi:hypothetical protein